MAKKRRGRPKGVKKKRRLSGSVAKRTDVKRRRLSAARLEKLREYQKKLTPGRGHNYARRKDCLRLIILLLVSGFIGQLASSEFVEQPQETRFSETFVNVSQQVMCSQSFLKRLWTRYESASSEIESPQRRGRKRLAAEVVYEGNQFPPKILPTLSTGFLR